MKIERSPVVSHTACGGGYRLIELRAPQITAEVRPGQFVHILIPRLEIAVLRRPFSVFQAERDVLRILYKPIGKGTETLALVQPGEFLNVMGPLGNGFPLDRTGTLPVLVAGGYGVAPLYLLAQRMGARGILFIGGASREHVLAEQDFRDLGWDVRVATEDASAGVRGLVTAALDAWLAQRATGAPPEFYACGPDGMLRAVGERAMAGGWNAWLSLDRHMGCGVGACLACVQRVRRPDGQAGWARVCKDGPVFEARQVVWEADKP
jgi:dihydroorotate dehydrogenase electron transfer subunit